jgi:hypothetical protein
MHNFIRTFAGASLAVLMLGLAVFNVGNWLTEGFIILAVVAACAELIGFVMAVMVEIAIRSKRYAAAGVCGLILTVCAGFNVIGAERAWDASIEQHLEGARMTAQTSLDAERAELQQKLATANAQIATYNHLLPGAETVRARQAGMQAAWEMATAQARTDAASAQAALDDMAVVASIAPPFVAWQVQVGFALAELIKALGLWACGFGAIIVSAAVSENTKKETKETPEPVVETETRNASETPVTNVISMKERAIQIRNERGLSYSKIASEIGCSKKHAWMLVNA